MNEAAECVAKLIATAQHNCDLADAFHAQGMSLCAYLLDLRAYYRWRQELPADAAIERAALSTWIAEREAHWEALRTPQAPTYLPLLAGASADPYAEALFNAALLPEGLVYGAGIGYFGRPLFFLAELAWTENREGIDIRVAGRELARGLSAPPAVSRDRHVLIRLDAMERWLWTKAEEWRHHPHDGGFASAWAMHAGLRDSTPGVTDDAIEIVRRMARAEAETVILHELGEQRIGADEEWADTWDRMIGDLDDRKAELFLRSIRDLLVDCAFTLPELLTRDAEASIHFWFGNFEGMRRLLAPELHEAYAAWRTGNRHRLVSAIEGGREHWRQACLSLLSRWQDGGEEAIAASARTPDEFIHHAVKSL